MLPVDDLELDQHNPLLDLGLEVNKLAGLVALHVRHLLKTGKNDALPPLMGYSLIRAKKDYDDAMIGVTRSCRREWATFALPDDEIEGLLAALQFERFPMIEWNLKDPQQVRDLDCYIHETRDANRYEWERLALKLDGRIRGFYMGAHDAYSPPTPSRRVEVPDEFRSDGVCVDGVQHRINMSEYKLLKLLAEARDAGRVIGLGDLTSKVPSPRKVLDRLKDGSVFAEVVLYPGGNGKGGYRLL